MSTKRLAQFGIALLFVLLVMGTTGCPPSTPVGDEGEGEGEGEGELEGANLARGGQLYDKWWNVLLAAEAPSEDHPLWATRPDTESNARSGADTWRCKECHGWDYKGVAGAYGSGSHRTGIAGISNVAGSVNRSKAAQDVFDEIKTGHSYGDVLADADIWDLAKFVLEGQIDTDIIIDGAGLFTGNPTVGLALYTACAVCHGADGLGAPPGSPDFDDFPGKIASENPWEFQHKVSFGQPGSAMPPLAGTLTVAQIGDLSAYVQTLPQAAPDVLRGGTMYDKWWAVTGADAPTENHALWATRPDTDSNARTGADTWRCKECHGWDYKGVAGAYGSGSHRTGFAGIFGADDAVFRSKSNVDAFGVIKDGHGYGAMMADADIWDLAAFVMGGQLDVDQIMDGTGAFTGDAAAGETLYAASCLSCHGVDGLTPPPGADVTFDAFPGKIANENPQEFQHKVSYGQPPGTVMTPLADTLTVTQIADLSAHVQTLPIE